MENIFAMRKVALLTLVELLKVSLYHNSAKINLLSINRTSAKSNLLSIHSTSAKSNLLSIYCTSAKNNLLKKKLISFMLMMYN